MPFSLRLDERMKSGGGRGCLTCGKTLNNSSACPIPRVLVIFPFEISVVPEAVDEMLGTLEGMGRFPPADKLGQLDVTRNERTTDVSSEGSSYPFH